MTVTLQVSGPRLYTPELVSEPQEVSRAVLRQSGWSVVALCSLVTPGLAVLTPTEVCDLLSSAVLVLIRGRGRSSEECEAAPQLSSSPRTLGGLGGLSRLWVPMCGTLAALGEPCHRAARLGRDWYWSADCAPTHSRVLPPILTVTGDTDTCATRGDTRGDAARGAGRRRRLTESTSGGETSGGTAASSRLVSAAGGGEAGAGAGSGVEVREKAPES